jgi:hypothetical protein
VINRRPITRIRPGAVTWAGGLPVRAPETSSTIRASVQPVDSWTLQRVEEGLRGKRWLRVMSSQELRCASVEQGIEPDILVIDGLRYQVHMVDAWPQGLIPHWAADVYAQEADEAAPPVLPPPPDDEEEEP